MDEVGTEQAAEFLFEMQMEVSSLSWAGGFTGSEGSSYELGVHDAIQAVYQAYQLEAGKLIIYPGARNGHTHTHARRLLRDGLKEVVPYATDLGIQLLIEPVVRKNNPWSFMRQISEYHEILDEFRDDEVGIALDLFHIGNRVEFLRELPRYANRVALVQVADGRFMGDEFVRCPLGQGIVPIDNWLGALMQLGYDGLFEVELHGVEFETGDYQSTLLQSKSYFDDTVATLQLNRQTNDSESITRK